MLPVNIILFTKARVLIYLMYVASVELLLYIQFKSSESCSYRASAAVLLKRIYIIRNFIILVVIKLFYNELQ